MQITGECSRQNTCYDCKSENCVFAGNKASDCPKYQCDRPDEHKLDCDHCEFVDEFIEKERKRYGSNR